MSAKQGRRTFTRLTADQVEARRAERRTGSGVSAPCVRPSDTVPNRVDAEKPPVVEGAAARPVPEPTPEPRPEGAPDPTPDAASPDAPAATSSVPTASSEPQEMPAPGAGSTAEVFLIRPARKVRFKDNDARATHLMRVGAHGDPGDRARIQPLIVQQIVRIPHVSLDSDLALLSISMQYGLWCLHNRLSFDLDRDGTEDMLQDYRERGLDRYPSHSAATHMSQLRLFFRGRRRRAAHGTRPYAKAPHSPQLVRRMWKAATDTREWYGPDLRTLLSLSHGAGLASVETHRARASWVLIEGKQVTIRVIAPDQFIRDVPVFGEYAHWLRARAMALDFDDLLFRPGYRGRRNATSKLVELVAKREPFFSDFTTVRARHFWVAQALTSGVPFQAVCQAAGIGRDSNLPTDLLPYLPSIEPAEQSRTFRLAFEGRRTGRTTEAANWSGDGNHRWDRTQPSESRWESWAGRRVDADALDHAGAVNQRVVTGRQEPPAPELYDDDPRFREFDPPPFGPSPGRDLHNTG